MYIYRLSTAQLVESRFLELFHFSCFRLLNRLLQVLGGLVSMSRFTSEGGGSADLAWSVRLRTSWKCCFLLTACSFSVVITLPCLSFTGMVWLVLLLHSCLVILFTVLNSPFFCCFFCFTSQRLNDVPLIPSDTPFHLYSCCVRSTCLDDLAFNIFSYIEKSSLISRRLYRVRTYINDTHIRI